jgi:hypothetical protein
MRSELDDRAVEKGQSGAGIFRDVNDLAASIGKAKRMPVDEPKVRNLLLNQRFRHGAAGAA